MSVIYMSRNYVPVAQLDRVSDYESEGSGFEPLQAHQKRRYEVFYYTSYLLLFFVLHS